MSSTTCNFKIRRVDCTLETCCVDQQGFLSYRPTIIGNGIYVIILVLLLLSQTVLFIRHGRTWAFYIMILVASIIEIIGYGSRIALSDSPFTVNYYVNQLITLTIAPAFIMAAIYMVIGRVIMAYGTKHSLIRPLWFSIICLVGDIISLVLQAAGGVMTSKGARNADKSLIDSGTHVVIGGLAFQLVSTSIFGFLTACFAYDVLRNKQHRNSRFKHLTKQLPFKAMLGALFTASLTVFIRSAFRVWELSDGNNSARANDETLFMVFEGPMIIMAILVLTIFHPGVCFKGEYKNADWGLSHANEEQDKYKLEQRLETRGDHPQVELVQNKAYAPPFQASGHAELSAETITISPSQVYAPPYPSMYSPDGQSQQSIASGIRQSLRASTVLSNAANVPPYRS